MAKKILIVDDDPDFLKLVDRVLTAGGYDVLKASNGREALRILFENKPDLVLLDVVMPKMDGWETCSRIREISDLPIIILTGRQKTEEAIVTGLEYGADDYLIKPLGNKELIARVKAILRRSSQAPSEPAKSILYADEHLTIDVKEHRITVKGNRIKLTPREFRLLTYLVENAGRIVSHQHLLEKVWGWEYINDVDYLRIYVSHLRQKIEPDPSEHRYIITEPGFGYRFR